MRPEKPEYYLKIASVILERGTCIRRNYGAVIVNNDQIVGTGYTGSPRGEKKLRNAILNNANLLGISDRAIRKLPDELLAKRAETLSPQELANIADVLFDEKI